jgi:tyrosyl-tRNA synthetase
MFLPVDEQLDRLLPGTEAVLPEDALRDRLESSRASGRPLTVKQGFDPTRPDLHVGHAVSLKKLRTFQELGHRVVFVIGDFTARIGDPSGRNETRPVLTEDEIERNLVTYRDQVARILDPEKTVLRRNSEWLGELDLADVLRLTSMYTVARMLERDDFALRYGEGRPISLSELLYPMMQAYDSVALEADVELGGTDQRFNLLLARTIQEKHGQDPQVCVIMPLLRGTDGEQKMSKSYDNYVGLTMKPEEIFGRTMSIPDHLLEEWVRLASSADDQRGDRLVDRIEQEPLQVKRWLAADLVEQFHGAEAAREAREAFDRVHREGGVPEDVDEVVGRADPESGTLWIGYALQEAGLVDSTSEAIRMLEQGAVRVDGETVDDRDTQLAPGSHLVQKGKRGFARVRVVGEGSDS